MTTPVVCFGKSSGATTNTDCETDGATDCDVGDVGDVGAGGADGVVSAAKTVTLNNCIARTRAHLSFMSGEQ